MKDLLKDFKIQRVLNQLSDSTIDLLVAKFCDEPSPDLKSLRKDKKKRDIAQALAEAISNHPRCIRALRVAHFFHKERCAFTGLRPFLSSYNEAQVDWDKIDAGKSEAEQAVLLYAEQEELVGNFFVMSLHTQQSRMYCSCRNDYSDDAVQAPDPSALEALKTKLLASLHRDRGSQFSDARSFSYDNKTFLMLEFDDLPSYQREYEKGKDKPVEKYPRLALGLVYVFDTRNKTIDIIAETPDIRLQMHQICAEVIYSKKAIDARPPKNEIFDLQALFDAVIAGTPLTLPVSDSGVRQAFVGSLRVQRTEHPFWETTVNIKIPKNHIEQEHPRDWVKDIRDCTNSRINTKPDPAGWWHRSYMDATQAELFVVYWDSAENKEVSQKVTVNSSGGTNLGHDETDEKIKRFFREIKLLKVCGDEDQGECESDSAATQAA
ncbi:MAG: hypothetical protein RBT70_09620 [Alphaproteobacteria bacterium]|jgi:hypothetical protein|nr:hypothetical protein [Alphaproteobacteria bacterium]